MVTLTPTTSPTSRPHKFNFRADIQGLRAIAVLLVVLYHAGVKTISGGYIGVDVFFVISGFLITTHLLESLEKDGRIALGQFYARRARRILPAAFTVLVLTVVAAVVWMPPLQLGPVFKGAIATAMYVPNMLFAGQGTNYLAETAPSVFQHYWSLGIEEQFYLVWPLALMLVFRALKSERSVFWAVMVLTVGSFILCLVIMPVSQPWAFFSLPTRAWELGVGGLAAFVMRAHGDRFAAARSGLLSWTGLLVLVIVAVTYSDETPFPGYYAAVPVLATALIIIGGVGRSGPQRLLGNRPMQFIGLISYSLYLVHWPLLVIPQSAVGLHNPLPLWATLGLGTLSFPVAFLLYRFVEEPFRKAKTPAFRTAPRTLACVAVTTAVIVGSTAGAFVLNQQRDLDADESVSATPVRQSPVGTSFVPENLTPSLRTASSDNALIYRNGCHRDPEVTDASGCQYGDNADAPLVALFGDSHAASWFPALHQLAEKGEIRLDTNTKSDCTSVDVPVTRNGQAYSACETWRDDVVSRLNSVKPDVVILANRALPDEANNAARDRWTAGLEQTIAAMPDTARTAVMTDIPDMVATPAFCLSAHLVDTTACKRPVVEALDHGYRAEEQAASAQAGASHLDLTDYLCNETTCPSIIGNELVYRDSHHLTATFSDSMADAMRKELSHLLK